MLFEAMIATDLPFTLGPPVPTSAWVALGQLLLTGRREVRFAACDLSPAAVLAGCYAALREVGARSLEVRRDGEELLDLAVLSDGDAAPRFPERLPPAWTAEPAAFSICAPIPAPVAGAPLAAVVHLRHTPRHLPDTGALTGAVRLVWTPPVDLPAAARARSLDHTLAQPVHLRELVRRVHDHGDALVARVIAALSGGLGPSIAADGRVSLLHGVDVDPAAFAELLHGLPPGIDDWLRQIADRCAAAHLGLLAVDARGVPGRTTHRGFTPVAEVAGV